MAISNLNNFSSKFAHNIRMSFFQYLYNKKKFERGEVARDRKWKNKKKVKRELGKTHRNTKEVHSRARSLGFRTSDSKVIQSLRLNSDWMRTNSIRGRIHRISLVFIQILIGWSKSKFKL